MITPGLDRVTLVHGHPKASMCPGSSAQGCVHSRMSLDGTPPASLSLQADLMVPPQYCLPPEPMEDDGGVGGAAIYINSLYPWVLYILRFNQPRTM